MVELLIVLVFISIIAAIAINMALYAFDVSRVSRTVADMRTVADAVTKYQSDSGALPGGGLQPVSAIAAILRPSADSVPTLDGWKHPIYYEPITTPQGSASFRLYSYGKDGTDDGTITGVWLNSYSDIVNEGGSFVQAKW
jgi:type II secretory pathway pseudopilin PulG